VGDWAIAIGNPLGQLRGSVTVGIVSATGRSDLNIFGGTPAFQDFIQTDASINFGNSGGPLCNIRGEAIGINTAINTSGQGIGFAIPINLAKHVAQQLMASGQVKRAMLGVYLAELTPEIAEGFGINGTQGVLIQNVVEDSPASRAGLRRNDVVVEYNGEPVTDMAKFRLKVADTPVGKRVPIVVLRDGKRVTLNVTLESRDEQKLASATPRERFPARGEREPRRPQGARADRRREDQRQGQVGRHGHGRRGRQQRFRRRDSARRHRRRGERQADRDRGRIHQGAARRQDGSQAGGIAGQQQRPVPLRGAAHRLEDSKGSVGSGLPDREAARKPPPLLKSREGI